MSFSGLKGFDKLEKSLNQIEKNIQGLNQFTVTYGELFTVSFMNLHTSHNSLKEFFEAGNFHVDTDEDLKAIPDEELDKYVSANTDFSTWEEMLKAAAVEHVNSKIKFNL